MFHSIKEKIKEKIKNTNPVALSELVRMVLVGLVSTGWLTLDNTLINLIVSAVSVVASLVLAVFTHRGTTPVPAAHSPTHTVNDLPVAE